MLSDKSVIVNALEEWMSSAPIVTSADPISWWSAMDATGHPLACMALDFFVNSRYGVAIKILIVV